MTLERWKEAWPLLRDVACVVAGLGGLIFEAVYGGPVRAELVMAWGGLLASPVFIRGDAKDRDSKDSTSSTREVDR